MNDMSEQKHLVATQPGDPDPNETAEWREALLSLAASQGPARARYILDELARLAQVCHLALRYPTKSTT